MNATLNGRHRRPQLSETIDKLDRMIDGLATAIPGAVADSVREVLSAVWPEVIQAAISRATANLAAALTTQAIPVPAAPAPAAPSPERPHLRFTRLRDWAAGVRNRIWTRVKSAALAIGCHVRRTSTALGCLVAMVMRITRTSPRATLGATLTGSAVGISGYHLGPEFAAALAGLAVGIMTLGGVWLAPFIRFLTPGLQQSSP